MGRIGGHRDRVADWCTRQRARLQRIQQWTAAVQPPEPEEECWPIPPEAKELPELAV
jgi:hypothetical protein